jgi:hypothetical protein
VATTSRDRPRPSRRDRPQPPTSWASGRRVPAALAGTRSATNLGLGLNSKWTLEFNATGGVRNGPSLVLEGGDGTAVRPISLWVTGPRSGGMRLEGTDARGCREFSYVADEGQLTLAATGARCPQTFVDAVLSRGFWERPR